MPSEHSERGANPSVITPWDAGHRQNVHNRKVQEVRPQTATKLDDAVVAQRRSLGTEEATAMRLSATQTWEGEARVRDTKQRTPFPRTPSAVGAVMGAHDKLVAGATKAVDAGGAADKEHEQLVAKGKEGRKGWTATTGPGLREEKLLEGRTVNAQAEQAYWHKVRVKQARAGRDNRQAMGGRSWIAAKKEHQQEKRKRKEKEKATGDGAEGAGKEDLKTKEEAAVKAAQRREAGWVGTEVGCAGNLQRTGTGLFPRAPPAAAPLTQLPKPTAEPKVAPQPRTLLKAPPDDAPQQDEEEEEPRAKGVALTAKDQAQRPGWAGAETGGPRDQCPPRSAGRRKGAYLTPDRVAQHVKRYHHGVAAARRQGHGIGAEMDATAGMAWRLKTNRDQHRIRREHHRLVWEAGARARRQQGSPRQRAAAELSKREARWREAARHLATHRQRVAELLREEGAGSGDDWAWQDEGSDEETEALLAKYAAVAPAWDVSDEESS